jgi:hypothetical protein
VGRLDVAPVEFHTAALIQRLNGVVAILLLDVLGDLEVADDKRLAGL